MPWLLRKRALYLSRRAGGRECFAGQTLRGAEGEGDVSYFAVVRGVLDSAALDLAGISAALTQAHTAAAGPTSAVAAAAEDEVSAAIAALFSSHGQQFQSLNARAAAFHAEFVQALNNAGSSYAAAEAANVSPLQPVKALTGR